MMQSLNIQNPVDLGDAIRAARKRQGLRQTDLALVAGTGDRFIRDLERGKETAQLGPTFRVLAALGISLLADSPADVMASVDD